MSKFLVFVLVVMGMSFSAEETLMADELPKYYAESVMIASLSADGSEDVSLRLARFPEKGIAHVWLHLAFEDQVWSLVDETFALTHDGATSIADEQVVFSAIQNDLQLDFSSSKRSSGEMQGRVTGTVKANQTRDPVNEPGKTPIEFDVSFSARSDGFRSQSNRWEMTGRLSGTIKVSGKTLTFDHSEGKWHEQTGPRSNFAPAFTYLNVQNESLTLLAIGLKDRAVGYVELGGKVIDVATFTIEPVGMQNREFLVTLSDGQKIAGTARKVQDWSVEIEGQMRPGSSIIVASSFGDLFGSLNDWQPEPR